MKFATLAFLICLTGAAAAQDVVRVETASGSVLRALDTITGKLADLEISNGQSVIFEHLEITVSECRYPFENPSSDAFAFVTIRETIDDEIKFEGWMTAASPALSAMDHPRYDVWVLRCKIPEAVTADED
jgi:hypothetical protein